MPITNPTIIEKIFFSFILSLIIYPPQQDAAINPPIANTTIAITIYIRPTTSANANITKAVAMNDTTGTKTDNINKGVPCSAI